MGNITLLYICNIYDVLNSWSGKGAHYSISLLWYAVAMHVQFFSSSQPKIFRALSGRTAPSRRRFKSQITLFLFRCNKHNIKLKKILAVINATYAVAKKKPEKIRLDFDKPDFFFQAA